MEEDMLNEEKLQSIRDQALNKACADGTHASWRLAYENLANAANALDAMLARTRVIGAGCAG